MPEKKPLKFKIAAHIVEDLGFNLYTNLPSVLIEFVANAHDAEAPWAKIIYNDEAVKSARHKMRKKHKYECDVADDPENDVEDLETQVLADEHKIIIFDNGHGMSRDDLDQKYLVAGRRRREEEEKSNYTKNGKRIVMGRKGLGKLAGFGVARKMEVYTKTANLDHVIKITMDYDRLINKRFMEEVPIEEEDLNSCQYIKGKSGTVIVLSRLLFDATKSKKETILSRIAEHFMLIRRDDFEMYYNSVPIPQHRVEHAFAWPDPERPIEELVDATVKIGHNTKETNFQYRIRFTSDGQALPASNRGIRVYANNRLACASSLLDADTNMHGFRMTDYMDGIVQANYIDEQKVDYIATDRQSLRWDSPMLSPLKAFLSKEIKIACSKYQQHRDKNALQDVENDKFTMDEIEKLDFSKRERKIALRISTLLRGSFKQGFSDRFYKENLPIYLSSIGRGAILTKLSKLAEMQFPGIEETVNEIIRLSSDEFDQYISFAKTRIKGISAFRKIVESADFKKKENEALVQRLFSKSPWLIDPSFRMLISSDEGLDTTFTRLAKEMAIGSYANTSEINDRRPDLVFMLGAPDLTKIIIVELKSTNTVLETKHLSQLRSYMAYVRDWMENHEMSNSQIFGQLIGSFDKPTSRKEGVISLRETIKTDHGPASPWSVRDYIQVLEDTKRVHEELIGIADKLN